MITSKIAFQYINSIMADNFGFSSPSIMSAWAQEAHSHMKHDFDNHFAFNIYAWAQEKHRDIKAAFNMKGGWEGWLQVELGLWLEQKGFEVEREQHVFKNTRQAADMIVTSPNSQGKDPVRTIVELKCESLFQDLVMNQSEPDESKQNFQKDPGFATRIKKDLEKFRDMGSNIRDEYRGVFYCCIGFSLTFEARDYVLGSPEDLFVAISKDQLAQHAARYGQVDIVLADQVPDDDLMMWWSRLYCLKA